jgi:hypothetical protein
MPVACGQPVAVIENDDLAVAALRAGEFHRGDACGIDGRAALG